MAKKDAYDWKRRLEMETHRLSGEFTRKEGIKVSAADRKIILEFIDECKAEGLSKPRIVNYMRILRLSKKFLPQEFTKATKQDMKQAIAKLETSDLKEWTKQSYKITFKKFFRWLYNEKLGAKLKRKEYPEIVEWINTTMKNGMSRLPEDILTESDIKVLLESCQNIRDKAIVALLWDSGCRVGEILNLQIKHLTFDKYGAQIIVYGKTGSRRVRLIPSVPYLATLKENHPDKNDPEAFLFIGLGTRNKGKRISYTTLDTMLRKLHVRAGVKKRCNAHSFRHARATYFASRVKESVMKESFGWTQKSQMVGIYTHLSGRDVDKEIRKAQGMADEEEKSEESKLKPKKCVRCGYENAATSKFCSQCCLILDEKIAMELEKKEDVGRKVWDKVTAKGNFSISRDLVKEVLKDMIKAGEIKL